MLDYLDVGEGEELVLIHGLGNRKEAWIPQMSLSLNNRLVLVELRGHGSSLEVHNLTVETFAKDVIEVLDYLHIKQAHICGLSLGGLVAQEIHRHFKHRVKSLILSNTTFYIPSMIGYMALSKTVDMIDRLGFDDYHVESIKSCLFNDADEKIYALAKKALHIRPDTYLQAIQSAFGRNYFYNLLGIHVPTLIIGASRDKITPVYNAYWMYYFIRKAKLIILEDAGHLANIEKAVEFNEAIEEHIQRFKVRI